MKILSLGIQATFESNDGWDTRTYWYYSPSEIVKGMKLRIGWLLIRIGTYVFYGKHGMNITKTGGFIKKVGGRE